MNLLDTTLRDGSYAINFTFSISDVRRICTELESCGIDYIEIGHGEGLNASPPALHSNPEYLSAAKESVKNAKIGMFCIPGKARLIDVDEIILHGLDFIRIGTSVNEVEKSKEYIVRAKNSGLFVAANYMKSYASSPTEFAEKAKMSESYGADCVYIVDSSGGMFASQIEEYADAVRSVSDISLGFHGHNNLGLAVSNSLRAAELGFDFLDCSLQGLGRSSGNAPTEQLVAALKKKGYPLDVNLIKIIEFGNEYVNPFIASKGFAPIDTISGYADFHTSFMQRIHKYAMKYEVNPLELIIEVCMVDKLTATDELVERVAMQLSETDITAYRNSFQRYHGEEQG